MSFLEPVESMSGPTREEVLDIADIGGKSVPRE
jgi:hypothetical protein